VPTVRRNAARKALGVTVAAALLVLGAVLRAALLKG
jgi:hypothetical protein